MLIFDNNNDVIVVDNIYAPMASTHFWVLDLNMMDYTMSPLLVLEEVVCPTIDVLIWGFQFKLPATWNMLVADEETMQLDVVEVADLAGKEFRALVYGPNRMMQETAVVQVVDYTVSHRNVAPSINKHMMLCHPISPDAWVCVSPSDSFNKYLKNAVAGDLV